MDRVDIEQICNTFEKTDLLDIKDEILDDPFAVYISGLSLQGADWDNVKGLLTENMSGNQYTKMPVFKLKTLNVRKVIRQNFSVREGIENIHEY